MLSLSWTEGALSERETRVGYNDPFQPRSQDQNKKRPFGRRLIAAVIVLIIIAVSCGFSLHSTTLYASYSGYFSSTCDPPDAMNWVDTLSLDQVVQDHIHWTFTGFISESGGCGGGCSGSVHGSVTPLGGVSFTFASPQPDDPPSCGNKVSFSGTIQHQKTEFSSVGGINGQIYYYGGVWTGNFQLAPASSHTV
jgi:hypothetical protein